MRRVAALLLALSWTLPAVAAEAENRFFFGSYGRVGSSIDPSTGGVGQQPSVVPFAPRLTEGNYLELDFNYRAWRGREAEVSTTLTLAFGDRFFHFDGEWDADLTLRQAFVEASKLFETPLYVWIGSRMDRGDDIYLFDVWPLDDLNTFGATIGWRGARLDASLHVGLNRLDSPYQVQDVAVPANDFGAEQVTVLDRQRRVVAARVEHRYGGEDGALGHKVRLYAELHHLPEGERPLDASYSETEPLPDDLGFMVGAQYGLWNFLGSGRNHVNVWARYAGGLAVYDELGVPMSVDTDRRAVDAREYRLAVSGNVELSRLAVMFGGYARFFFDADDQEEDFDDKQQFAFAVRPMLRYGVFTPGVEASVQASRPNGLNPRTLSQDVARVTQLALVPALSFGDDAGSYTRPQLRFIYAVSLLNQAALDLYAEEDPRSTEDVVHFVGVRAEWWFGRGGGY